jgi:hypothetical protein
MKATVSYMLKQSKFSRLYFPAAAPFSSSSSSSSLFSKRLQQLRQSIKEADSNPTPPDISGGTSQ